MDVDPFFQKKKKHYISCVAEEKITFRAFVKGISRIYFGS